MNPKKVARICWNTNNWQKPSGPEGKSSSIDSYENSVGYGHEEWLLDNEKIINGFHYAFLQTGTSIATYAGNVFDIYLYSINNQTGTRWWLGKINNVQMIDSVESKKVCETYKKKGWLKEMIEELKEVDANHKEFSKINPDGFATLKFRLKDLDLLDTPLQFSNKDSAVPSARYKLLNFRNIPKYSGTSKFVFKKGHSHKSEFANISYEEHSAKINLAHNRLQEKVYKHLCKVYGKNNVASELVINSGPRIDVVVKQGAKYTFYEIKTSNSVLNCIREAIPQLLEYAYFPNRVNAQKLIIISYNIISPDAEKYLKHLRKKFNIPLYYQRFNDELQVLEKQI